MMFQIPYVSLLNSVLSMGYGKDHLNWKTLENDRIVELTFIPWIKRGSSRFWGGIMVFWLFQEQISDLNKGKSIKNWQTGTR